MSTARYILLIFLLCSSLTSLLRADPPQPQPLPRPQTLRKIPDESAQPTTQPAPPFIIGVFAQPVDSLARWKARGINTMVSAESQGGRVSVDEWADAVRTHGLFMICQPGTDLAADANDPWLLAWMHGDEPDIRHIDPDALAADYARWKKAGPDKPVFLNFSGGDVLKLMASRQKYADYMKSADWIGNDYYPVTGYNRPDHLGKIGEAVDTLRKWSDGKPQFCCIECSDQKLSWTPKSTRGVTPDELRGEIWHAIIHGVRGIVYFPQQFADHFQYDATTEDVTLEMVRQNRRLIELGPMLAGDMNPGPGAARADDPVQVGWRTSGGKTYVIALNFSDKPVKAASIALTNIAGAKVHVLDENRDVAIASGRIQDDFGPFEAHVYEVDR